MASKKGLHALHRRRATSSTGDRCRARWLAWRTPPCCAGACSPVCSACLEREDGDAQAGVLYATLPAQNPGARSAMRLCCAGRQAVSGARAPPSLPRCSHCRPPTPNPARTRRTFPCGSFRPYQPCSIAMPVAADNTLQGFTRPIQSQACYSSVICRVLAVPRVGGSHATDSFLPLRTAALCVVGREPPKTVVETGWMRVQDMQPGVGGGGGVYRMPGRQPWQYLNWL